MQLQRERSTQPFAAAFSALLADRGLSRRRLARLTLPVDGRGLGHTYLSMLASGEKAPTTANMVLLASCLGVDPMFFREYREAMVQERTAVLVERHGADAVLQALASLDDPQA